VTRLGSSASSWRSSSFFFSLEASIMTESEKQMHKHLNRPHMHIEECPMCEASDSAVMLSLVLIVLTVILWAVYLFTR